MYLYVYYLPYLQQQLSFKSTSKTSSGNLSKTHSSGSGEQEILYLIIRKQVIVPCPILQIISSWRRRITKTFICLIDPKIRESILLAAPREARQGSARLQPPGCSQQMYQTVVAVIGHTTELWSQEPQSSLVPLGTYTCRAG